MNNIVIIKLLLKLHTYKHHTHYRTPDHYYELTFFFEITNIKIILNQQYLGDITHLQDIYKSISIFMIFPKSSNL